jgi:hypothetical protein
MAAIMRMLRLALVGLALSAAILAISAAALSAQVPSRPKDYGAGVVVNLDKLTTDLSDLYFTGQWDALQKKICDLGLWIEPKEKEGNSKIRENLDPEKNFYIVVFLARDEGGERKLIRFAWHKPAPAPYAASIPGKKEIFEIVLGAGAEYELTTSYVSTQTEDPLLAEVPKFVKKIETIFIDIIDTKNRTKQVTANFKVNRVVLPYERAKVHITDVAELSKQAAAKSGVKEVKASFDFKNAPWTRWSFGLLSAYTLGRDYAKDRIRLTDDGYYAANPPGNPMTAALLNIHPLAFDPDTVRMTLAERIRLFVGGVLSPDAGVCAGAGFGLLRGLAVNAGVALMGLRTARDPHALVINGRAKTEPGDANEPFKTAWKAVGFLGFGYSF